MNLTQSYPSKLHCAGDEAELARSAKTQMPSHSTETFYHNRYPVKVHSPKLKDFSLVYLNHKVQLGIVTRRQFCKGDVVADLNGEVVTDIRQHTVQISDKLHLFDPYFSGYISHSCDPNLQLIGADLQLIALKDIAAQERLTLDYNDTEDTLFKAFQCQCGAAQCQGWIEGKNPTKYNES